MRTTLLGSKEQKHESGDAKKKLPSRNLEREASCEMPGSTIWVVGNRLLAGSYGVAENERSGG